MLVMIVIGGMVFMDVFELRFFIEVFVFVMLLWEVVVGKFMKGMFVLNEESLVMFIMFLLLIVII